MKVAAHNGAPVWGGGEVAQVALLKGLVRRGHEVVLHCNHESVAAEAKAMGLQVEISYLGGDAAIHHAWRFARKLRRYRPDVLLLGFYKKNFLAAGAGRLARVPRIVARIELQRSPPSAKYRFVFNHFVDAIVTVADSVRRVYLEAGYPPERVFTIYNAFEFARPSRSAQEVRRSLSLPERALVVGAVGRLVEQKRFDRLLRAVAYLPDHVHCLIAGEGVEREDLETLASELGIKERVRFLGWRRDVRDLMEVFDLLALVSDYEGLAIVMTEALAAGVPVISTPVSGVEETLRSLTGGIAPGIIVPYDAESIADAIEDLLSDPERRRAMGESGRALSRTRFSFEKMLDRWERVLQGPE